LCLFQPLLEGRQLLLSSSKLRLGIGELRFSIIPLSREPILASSQFGHLALSGSELRLALVTLCTELLLAGFQLGHLLTQLAYFLPKLILGRCRGPGGIRKGSPAAQGQKRHYEHENPEQG